MTGHSTNTPAEIGAATEVSVPDLENGAIFHGEQADNAWITEIQAVLVEHRGERVRSLYLAHECRKERLPFCNGPLGGGGDIFMRHKPYDFLTFTVNGRFWEFPLVDTIVPRQALSDLKLLQIQDSLFMLPNTRSGWRARVRCPLVPASVLPMADVHRRLADGTLVPRRLFCRFAWKEDGIARELYFPARYVNFSTRPQAGAYLQPISGYVLVPFRDSYQPAYLACAIAGNGETITEFLVPRYVEATDRLAQGYGFDGNMPPFSKLREMMPAYVRLFDWVRKISGDLTFYGYGEAS